MLKMSDVTYSTIIASRGNLDNHNHHCLNRTREHLDDNSNTLPCLNYASVEEIKFAAVVKDTGFRSSRHHSVHTSDSKIGLDREYVNTLPYDSRPETYLEVIQTHTMGKRTHTEIARPITEVTRPHTETTLPHTGATQPHTKVANTSTQTVLDVNPLSEKIDRWRREGGRIFGPAPTQVEKARKNRIRKFLNV